MYKGYNISDDFKKFCCEEAGDVNSPMMQEFIAAGIRSWENLKTDDVLKISDVNIKSSDGAEVPAKVITPHDIEENCPCLVYYHGGGFLTRPAEYQIRNVCEYARKTPCKVVMVDYRIAPQYVYPIAANDCYSTLLWTAENAKELCIDKNRIAVGGDSAGGDLAAAVSQMSRDKNGPHICFQMLNYPVTDFRMNDTSMKKFNDTPIWNSNLNKIMWDLYLKDGYDEEHPGYVAPLVEENLNKLPDAYVEIAEFDCLRDQGLHYAEALREAGVSVDLVETNETIHAYDVVADSDITKKYMGIRIEALRKAFGIK